jgi:hypothetical protein
LGLRAPRYDPTGRAQRFRGSKTRFIGSIGLIRLIGSGRIRFQCSGVRLCATGLLSWFNTQSSVYRGVARQSEDGSPALSPFQQTSRLEEPLLKRRALKAQRSSRSAGPLFTLCPLLAAA